MLLQKDVTLIVLMVFSLHKKDKRSCELVNRYGCHSRDQFSKRVFMNRITIIIQRENPKMPGMKQI